MTLNLQVLLEHPQRMIELPIEQIPHPFTQRTPLPFYQQLALFHLTSIIHEGVL
jgi:hypothetical protein